MSSQSNNETAPQHELKRLWILKDRRQANTQGAGGVFLCLKSFWGFLPRGVSAPPWDPSGILEARSLALAPCGDPVHGYPMEPLGTPLG